MRGGVCLCNRSIGFLVKQPERLRFNSRGQRPRIAFRKNSFDPERVGYARLVRPLQGRNGNANVIRWRCHRLLNRTLSACVSEPSAVIIHASRALDPVATISPPLGGWTRFSRPFHGLRNCQPSAARTVPALPPDLTRNYLRVINLSEFNS
jgi:hypothetical protein